MKKKIIFIGNSIVAGYPWSKGKSFVSIFRRMWKDRQESGLKTPAASLGLDIINKGVNGDTTAGILGRFKEDVLDHRPDMVFIMTGTNDFIYRDAGPEEAFENLNRMAEMLDGINATTVFMTPLPVDAGKAEYMWMAGLGISYDAVNRDLEKLSDLIRNSDRPFVDFNGRYRDFVKEVDDVDLACLDGLHPMPAGHEFLAAEVLNFFDSNTDMVLK